ncbi:ArsR/SmtB family transcription factor [Halorarius halobius]|uniref:ArsR/SmtB family transcription factor n=1 Tax=Halorarius halobius TaxID=2962671 RepID=UPI0020CF7E2F|nr:helix-turn-helix domain-containing protein [Halorarius halobius]
MSLLPSKPDVVSDGEPRVVGVDSEDADALMSALSSETARRLLSELHDEPAPPSELADRADTTLQNTQYHLSNLEDAGAVEVVGTAYSSKGREMDVYAPADEPLVIFAGQDEQASGLRAALSRLLGGVGALLVGSVAVQEVFGDGVGRLVGFGSNAGGGAQEPRSAGGPTTDTTTEADTTTDAGDAIGGAGGGDGGATGTPTTAEPSATNASDGPGVFTSGDATSTVTETPVPEASTPTPTAQATPAATGTPSPTPVAADGGLDVVAGLPPGLLFFLGGLTVLLVVVAVAYRE